MGIDKEHLNKLKEALLAKNGKLKRVQSVLGVILFVGFIALVIIGSLTYYGGGLFTDTMSLASAAFCGAPPGAYKNMFTGSEEQMAIVSSQANSQMGLFGLEDIQLTQDADDPDAFHYTCTVPGPCNAAYEKLFCRNITNDTAFSPRIEMSGTMRVVTTPQGKRRIDLGDGQNPLWLRASIIHIGADESLPDYNAAGLYTNTDAFKQTQIGILQQVGVAYLEAFGTQSMSGDLLLGQLKGYVEFLNGAPAFSTNPDYGERLPITTMLYSVRVPMLASLLSLAAVLVAIIVLAVFRIRLTLKAEGYEEELRADRMEGLHFEWEKNRLDSLFEQMKTKQEKQAEEGRDLRLRISTVKKPSKEKEFLHSLNNDFEQARQHTSGEGVVTRGGWALTALIRSMVSGFTLEMREKTAAKLQSVWDEYNKMAQEFNEYIDEIRPIEKKVSYERTDEEKQRYEVLVQNIKRLSERLKGGIVKRCLDADCVPLDYFVQLACDRHGTDRFLRQCALIGILPWMEENRADEQTAKKLAMLYAAREEMISGASQMAFFEVRVPPDCEVAEYAELLGETLRYANPNFQYCDLKALMDHAAKEVPGLMELLRLYPLRLIDPKNTSTEGFFEFQPFIHIMWVQYQPPLNVGKVQRRYHEALDMTKPNAAGINIRLFENEYGVVPVLFHEYCHYCGDHNEASVWLRTQLFSQRFYKEYEDSDPTADYTFVHMQNLLGAKPNPDKTEELGLFIEKYYGKQVSQAEGKQIALMRIMQINMQVQASNASTTWGPEITFPYLGDEVPGDTATYNTITRAVMRYATMPRAITKEQFNAVIDHFMPDEGAENDSFYKNEAPPSKTPFTADDLMNAYPFRNV